MSLSSGTRLGPYEILTLLGAGGMGEVYRARDTKLNRDVALKVLPDAFTRDPERLARFEREAQLLAALNHPHIATLHGLETVGGVEYLVMELVSGKTLAERLERGPLSVSDALPLFTQIASALEAAHDKGIVHRDLKPANIKITPEGRVKVLDFGLATSVITESTPQALSQSPTALASRSAVGSITGTAAYMSPEQARGLPVDRRTDVWAFGCVQTNFDERNGVVSPDGRWLAYEADDTGAFEIYVRPFPEVNRGHWQVSVNGGTQPLWARSGQELFYFSPDGTLMRIGVAGEPAWTAGSPAKLGGHHVVSTGGNFQGNYDVAADGQRFLMLKEPEPDTSGTPAQMIVVLHFDEELKRLAPTR